MSPDNLANDEVRHADDSRAPVNSRSRAIALSLSQPGSEPRALARREGVRPRLLDRVTFENFENGHLALLTKRASLSDLGKRVEIFRFTWAINNYCQILDQFSLTSFSMQIFGVISPLVRHVNESARER